MADSTSFLPPLCERISYKSYAPNAMDLTIFSLLFSLLLYRILHMNQNDTVWVMAFFCESCFFFMWLLFSNVIWSPVKHRPYPDRLDERVQELPSVDIFVTTADPVREPPILVVNSVLSLLSVNYPANKLACYVSDDGCSSLTYFSLKEASKFAKIWVPFCKKYNVKVRAPFRYFLDAVKSVVGAIQRKPNPQSIHTNSIEAVKEVGNIHYEYQTNWGKTVGWLYDSIAKDLNTSIRIHSRGWTSSSISLDPPAFRGCMPPVGLETFPQRRRWMMGGLEVFFNKQSPLIGMFHQKLRFRQRLAYLAVSMEGLGSLPMLFYCLLPAYSLLRNSSLFPKGFCSGITITFVGMHCLYTLRKFMSTGFSIQPWYIPICGSLFSVFDITLKLLGISKTVFIVTNKTMVGTKSGSGYGPSQPKENGLNVDSGNSEIDGSLFFLPGTFILLVNLAALAGFSLGLRMRSRSDKGGGSGLEEVCGCMFVATLFLPFLMGLLQKGKYGIPLSTLSKAAFLAFLFIVFSL